MPKAAQALAGKPAATVYTYPGRRHAFSRQDGEHDNAQAATLANGRTREFLQQQLRRFQSNGPMSTRCNGFGALERVK
jgi:carboxymethylenebutenolidase